MLPVVTVDEMRAIDAAASEPTDVLIRRAGSAVARHALQLLGGAYGRRVVVLAGPGNNGADGRVAAELLARRGVAVEVVPATDGRSALPPADLVVDAALGTGVTRPYEPPAVGPGTPVLAVDVPSGLHGDTGEVLGRPLAATATVTFAALKPGLALGAGPALCGRVVVADIGLDVGAARVHVIEDRDIAERLPPRPRDLHKWRRAVLVVAGSPGMTGAASLASEAAMRAGAGMVRLLSPGAGPGSHAPREVVSLDPDDPSWARNLLESSHREHAAVVGPGLGTSMATRHQVRTLVAGLDLPTVIDGDGLTALGADAASILKARGAPTVLTPHDGEFERLTGHRPGIDRIADVRALAAATDSVVLLKGPTTVVADPHGAARLVTSGDPRLATAGSGDVLAGIVVALLAAGIDALDAAAIGAHLHGRAGAASARHGAVASDVVAAIGPTLSALGPEEEW